MSTVDDESLFRQHLKDVVRLHQDRASPWRGKPSRPETVRLERAQNEPEKVVFANQPDAEVDGTFHRGGLQKAVLRRLRRGDFRPERRLDLHGFKSHRASIVLQKFLNQAARESCRTVLVVHGKGAGSEDRTPVIKKLSRSLLQQHRAVLAYCNAMPFDGGDGAVYVYLKKGFKF